ncbi:MAG: glycosyltransferase family 1 protein, partial [Candidatus Magasanikbacteria bacterium]
MQDKFKVTISVGGRFHAFNLAHQLTKRGHLQNLITSYPKFETVKYGVPKSKIDSILIKEILERG